jgi:hypothetical protein
MKLPQFRIRQLLALMALVAVLCFCVNWYIQRPRVLQSGGVVLLYEIDR